jgi:hypothetical protein
MWIRRVCRQRNSQVDDGTPVQNHVLLSLVYLYCIYHFQTLFVTVLFHAIWYFYNVILFALNCRTLFVRVCARACACVRACVRVCLQVTISNLLLTYHRSPVGNLLTVALRQDRQFTIFEESQRGG